MTEARKLLERVLGHCEELREAWERGAPDEHDGKGGTRSNRNVALVVALHAFLAAPARGDAEKAVLVAALKGAADTIKRCGTHGPQAHVRYEQVAADTSPAVAALLAQGAALAVALEWRDKLFANPSDEEAWDALVGEDGCLDNEARAALAPGEEE